MIYYAKYLVNICLPYVIKDVEIYARYVCMLMMIELSR